VLLAGCGDQLLQLVIRPDQPRRSVRVAAGGDVPGVRVRVGGDGAGDHLQPADEPVVVRDVLQQVAEPLSEGFLVFAVPASHAGAFDLDRGGDGAPV